MGFRVIDDCLMFWTDYPMENVEPLPMTDLDKIAGHWSTYRHPVTTPDKIIRALQTVVVQPVSDNELMVTGLAETPPTLEFKRVDAKCYVNGCLPDAGRNAGLYYNWIELLMPSAC